MIGCRLEIILSAVYTSFPTRRSSDLLSSCSTAAGDNRAVLGLAGITVRAGARSTLSTLWEAQDDPNTELMIQFYRELKKDGMTRAKALRNAQLALINQGYRAPNRWATYVLVGNWL